MLIDAGTSEIQTGYLWEDRQNDFYPHGNRQGERTEGRLLSGRNPLHMFYAHMFKG